MRSLYLETRLLPIIPWGERVSLRYPDGTVYEFRACEMAGANFQRLSLERIDAAGLGSATFEGPDGPDLSTKLSTDKGTEGQNPE